MKPIRIAEIRKTETNLSKETIDTLEQGISTETIQIRLKDPKIEFRSSMAGSTSTGHLVYVETYGDLASLLFLYGAKKQKIEERIGATFDPEEC